VAGPPDTDSHQDHRPDPAQRREGDQSPPFPPPGQPERDDSDPDASPPRSNTSPCQHLFSEDAGRKGRGEQEGRVGGPLDRRVGTHGASRAMRGAAAVRIG
jgi:hypothetical protein